MQTLTDDKTADNVITEVNDNLDFESMRTDLASLIKEATDRAEQASTNRKRRITKLDTNKLRKDGTIQADASLIPIRTIDSAIAREQPPFISYLKGERRIMAMRCVNPPGGLPVNTEPLEAELTTGLTYPGWEIPYTQALDGGELHGWDAVEVVFNENKPLHVDVEHVGFDMLAFACDARNIQHCPNVLRGYDWTIDQIKNPRCKFAPAQIQFIKDGVDGGPTKEKVVRIWKRYFRIDGNVWVGWFCMDHGCDDWLRAPEPLRLGIHHGAQDPMMPGQITWTEADLTQYPIFIYQYRITENHEIVSNIGRGELDWPRQEASTALVSAYITHQTRASYLMGAADKTPDGSSIKQLETVKFKDGMCLDQPFKFFTINPPDPGTLRALQYLDVQASQETGQMNFAVNNRVDSRKTATEIQAAQQQSSLLNSVQVTMFSVFLRDIYTLTWQIIQSQALQDKVRLLATFDPQTGDYIGNDKTMLSLEYDVRAAGDFDVIQRAEKLDRLGNFIQMVAGTPLAQTLLEDMISLAFPEDAQRYRAVLQQAMQQQQMMQQQQSAVGAIMNVLQPIAEKLPPEILQQIAQIAQQASPQNGPQSSGPAGAQPPAQ